jgi:glycosyltransferase involved in cell wall biosynthesis
MVNPEISIIVPVFNVEKYLSRCIESILNQTFRDFELILINDGSSDDSGNICDEYYRNYGDFITLIHQDNGGLSKARNVGLKRAVGKYITFIDSDDFISKDFLEVMYHYMINYNIDFVACNFILYKCGELPVVDFSQDNYVLLNMNSYFLKVIENPRLTSAWGKLYTHELFREIQFPEGKIMEDMFVLPKLLQRAKSTILSSLHLYYYNQIGESITRSPFRKEKLDMIEALDEWVNFADNHLPELKDIVKLHYLDNILHYCESLYSSDSSALKLIYIDYRRKVLENFDIIVNKGRFPMKLKLFFLKSGIWPVYVKLNNIKLRIIEIFKA